MSKGSKRRKTQVNYDKFAENWDRIWRDEMKDKEILERKVLLDSCPDLEDLDRDGEGITSPLPSLSEIEGDEVDPWDY